MSRFVVIGDACVNIHGQAYRDLDLNKINPGAVNISIGGTGLNIARNLKSLGAEVYLITAIGEDDYSEIIEKKCDEYGINTDYSACVGKSRAAYNIHITDLAYHTLFEMSDRDVMDIIKPAFLDKCEDIIVSADAVIIDGSIRKDTLTHLVNNYSVPVFATPLDAERAEILKPYNKYYKGYATDLETAIEITKRENPEEAAKVLLSSGLESVFINMKTNGMLAATMDLGAVRVSGLPCVPLNIEGANEAITAVSAWGYTEGLSLLDISKAAAKAYSMTMSCKDACNPDISPEKLLR